MQFCYGNVDTYDDILGYASLNLRELEASSMYRDFCSGKAVRQE